MHEGWGVCVCVCVGGGEGGEGVASVFILNFCSCKIQTRCIQYLKWSFGQDVIAPDKALFFNQKVLIFFLFLHLSSAMAASTRCARNAVGSSAWQRTQLQTYTVPGNCTPLGWQTIEGSPSQIWQAGGGSFLLLPKRHALSSRWL